MDLLKDNQKRHEIKFLINSKDKHELIDKNQLKKLFPDRIVESVYFDTEDLQYNPNTSYSYDKIIRTATVDANSDVTIELPAIADPYNVTVKFPDLELPRTYSTGTTTTTETEVYEKSDTSVTIWDGAQEFRTETYYF